jgi:vacuolar-type H+-ATPase subunit H
VWLALWYPVAIVLNALARSQAEKIRTSTTIACIKAEDELLKSLRFSATERRKRAIERLDRDRASR